MRKARRPVRRVAALAGGATLALAGPFAGAVYGSTPNAEPLELDASCSASTAAWLLAGTVYDLTFGCNPVPDKAPTAAPTAPGAGGGAPAATPPPSSNPTPPPAPAPPGTTIRSPLVTPPALGATRPVATALPSTPGSKPGVGTESMTLAEYFGLVEEATTIEPDRQVALEASSGAPTTNGTTVPLLALVPLLAGLAAAASPRRTTRLAVAAYHHATGPLRTDSTPWRHTTTEASPHHDPSPLEQPVLRRRDDAG